ncbi:MAG: VOC family protein [Nocardioides sp.]|uniref:VOC family protein n=1 Tax=Nocardioides sp. TaxID=35761 RepID=UPI003F02ABA4
MPVRLTELAVDCDEPERLAAFWCAVLDYVVVDAEDGLVTIGPADEDDGREGPGAPVLTFAQVPEEKAVKNRVHLDLSPTDGDQDGEVRRLIDLGARHTDVGQDPDVSWVVLADPEGNEFCVLAGE